MKAFKILPSFVVALVSANFASAQTWVQTSAPNTNEWISVASSADGVRLAAAAGGIFGPGLIYASTNSGADWMQTSAATNYWNALASSADGTKLVAVAFGQYNNEYGGGLIYISTNSGSTWTATSAPTNSWNSVASSSDGSKLAAAAVNSIYVSIDSGFTWTQTSALTVSWSSIVSSANGTKLVAAGNRQIYTSSNFGANWITNTGDFGGPSISMASSTDGNKLAAVSPVIGLPGGSVSGGIYLSTNSGAIWATNNIFGAWRSIAASANGSKLVTGTGDGYIYVSNDSGNTWMFSTNLGPNKTFTSFASSADGNKLVALVSDGGIWTLQATPSPQLNISPVNANLKFSWTVPSTNFVLQQSSDLISWADVTNIPALNLTNLQNEVTLSPSNNRSFYRLKIP